MPARCWIVVAAACLMMHTLAGCRTAQNTPKEIVGQRAAIAQLRVLLDAETAYNGSRNHFACSLAELADSPGLIDRELASGQKDGYAFSIHCNVKNVSYAYQVWAAPLRPAETGADFYCIDPTSVIRRTSIRLEDCDKASPVD